MPTMCILVLEGYYVSTGASPSNVMAGGLDLNMEQNMELLASVKVSKVPSNLHKLAGIYTKAIEGMQTLLSSWSQSLQGMSCVKPWSNSTAKS